MSISIQLPDETLEAIAQRAAEIVAGQVEIKAAPDPWLNVDQAAEHLACGRQRIYNLVSQRRLRHVKDGSRVLFRRQWLDEHLEASS